jgi:two-component system NtrC family sensor kinase
VSDIVMPGNLNGLDLARIVRTRYGDDLPIVLTTGYSIEAKAASAEGYPLVRKPYTRSEIHTVLTAVLQKTTAPSVNAVL